MGGASVAVAYALFVWWFSTGLVFLLVLRGRRARRWSVGVAALLVPFSLYVLARGSADASVFGAYSAFTAAILLWGAQEIGFLTGFVTGPRPLPCPAGLALPRRAAYATAAILYHETALVLSGVAVAAVTWNEANQVGGATFLILWVMRLSAKINLFLGVPVVNDEVMPDELVFLRSYFTRGPANPLFPLTMGLALAVLAVLAVDAWSTRSGSTACAGHCLLATLLGLAILEHGFMLVRLPVDVLWRWSTRRGTMVKGTDDAGARGLRTGPHIEQSLPTRS